MKELPYGISDFKRIRRDNMFYVDKTMYLPLLEKKNSYLLLVRPRRFGKSLFLSMMESYYDIRMEARFNELFGDLWIGQNPTPLANKFQILHFDFSHADSDLEKLEGRFNEYCSNVLDQFVMDYKEFYDDITVNRALKAEGAESKLDIITLAAKSREYRLYLIIDEYDNFTNNILANYGQEDYEKLTHSDGFYRYFFKLFKGSFERIFMIGVSPVTLDDLTSGYNIDWNISNMPKFNSMLGFREEEVRQMLQYYKDNGLIKRDIDGIISDMKPLYDNYCFALKSYGRETVYNCDMAMYYIDPILDTGEPPKELIDKNIRFDISKLQMLVTLNKGVKLQDRICSIEALSEKEYVDMNLKSSFPAKDLFERDNFLSFMYYLGMLTIGGIDNGLYHMIIPNECVRHEYWGFMKKIYESLGSMEIKLDKKEYKEMVCEGKWLPVIEKTGRFFEELSSVRDAIGGEHNVLGFFKAMLGLSDYSTLFSETELNYGYTDFLLFPLQKQYPDATHCYVFELKYVKKSASESEIVANYNEAESQIRRYTSSPRFLKIISGCTLHGIVILFHGPHMEPPRIIVEKNV